MGSEEITPLYACTVAYNNGGIRPTSNSFYPTAHTLVDQKMALRKNLAVAPKYHRLASKIALFELFPRLYTVPSGMGSSGNVCPEKNRLLDSYEQCAASFSTALTDLRQRTGVLSQPKYQALYDHTEVLRMKAREAQEAATHR
jgi:hypothetical protein